MQHKPKIKETVLGFAAPKAAHDSENYDKHCPFTGGLSVSPEFIRGRVVKKDTHNSATIEWERQTTVPKYERVEKRRSKAHVHNPPCINAQVGDFVVAAKTRPLSKTKHFVILHKEEQQ